MKTLYQPDSDMESLISKCITPDYPIKGVNFLDIFPLVDHHFSTHSPTTNDEVIAFMPEARGFLFWSLFKHHVPLRKKPFPSQNVEVKTVCEYDSKSLHYSLFHLAEAIRSFQEDHPDKSPKFVIFDDLIATGGTINAIVDSIRERFPDAPITASSFIVLSNVYSDSISVPVTTFYSLDLSEI